MNPWDAAECISRTLSTTSILLATTGRPEMAETCVRSILATTREHDIELVVAVDADPETAMKLESLQGRDRFRLVVDYRDHYRGCSRAWNDALALSTGDHVVLAADDLVFQPGWLDAAKRDLASFPDGWGFVGFNDGHFNGDLSTHYMVSKRLIREAFGGVIAWEHYEHSFNDCEANERAKRAGRYKWCEQAHVAHTHWLFGGRQQDTTDTKNLGGHPASEQKYAERLAAGFPNDFEPVI